MAEASGTVRLGRSAASLLAASDDLLVVAGLLPGCSGLHRTDAEHLEGRLATEVAGIPIAAAVSVRRTVESLEDGTSRLHLRLKIRPDIGGQATIAALVDLRPVAGEPDATDAAWRSSSELDPILAVMAGQRVESFLRASIERLIAGLAA